MFLKVAGFEFKFQRSNPVFWASAALFFLFAFGMMASDAISVGGGGNIHENSPDSMTRAQLIFSIFYMFATTAFVANVIVRDDETGFGPIVRSTRITKFDYLFGRFLGAFLAAALAFAAVPLGFLIGSVMPWLDPDTLGPNRPEYFLFGYFLLAVPGIFLTGAIFFALATITRSMMATYLGVVAFLIAYFVIIAIMGSQPQLRDTLSYVEPFGLAAYGETTRYWTAAERNTILPSIGGVLLANRLIWLGVALAFLGLAYSLYRFADRGQSKRKLKKQRIAAAAPAPAISQQSPVGPLPAPRFDGATARAQLLARTRFEMKQVFRSPAFLVLMVLGLVNSISSIWFSGDIFGTPTRPATFSIIPVLNGTFSIIPIIIAIYYAGELVWRERDRKTHEIIDSTPLPNWAYVVPKTLAVALVLFSTLVISMVAAILTQLGKGYTDIELGKYLAWYVLPLSVDMILLAALAVFVQSISPNKYVGWGIMVIYIVMQIVLSSLSFQHNLYLYGGTPPSPVSDMNADGGFQVGAWWFRLYWTAFAIILLVLAHLLWRRGTETRLKPRMARVPARLRGTPGVIAAAALAVFAATGAYAFYNTNVLNEYRTKEDGERLLAEFEKKYLKYDKLPQPTITHVDLKVDLQPEQRRAEFQGRYVLRNLTQVPIRDVHVRETDELTDMTSVVVAGAALASHDDEFGYRIFRLARPMAPGETRELTFTSRRWQRGFPNGSPDTRVVRNGTFINNYEFAPQIGVDRMGMLQDRSIRRKYGLPPELRPAKLEDLSATSEPYFGGGWSTADITVSTSADQTPIAPGKKVSDVTAGGRRTARFVSDAPILTFFSIQSARYLEKHLRHAGVDLGVYYHPEHAFNVDTMLKALQTGLDYYQSAFGPYQFDQARIIEFPGYATFAQAFANTMPYSEAIGFIADNSDPDEIDYVTYITAHELAHQYWAHQLIGANMQGGTLLSETLAQYSALMVMKRLYGEDKIRRFLKFELDNYLRNRGGEVVEELPLARVENQQYIHYRKGSVVMYLLQERLGEDAVNRALRTVLERYKFKGAPYARSVDLIQALRAEADTPEEQALITDLLERITIYDLKVKEPKAVRRADGKWDVTVPVEAGKLYVDGRGNETQAPLSEPIEIGLFTAEPGEGSFDRKNVILMQRRPIRRGNQVLRFITDRKPTHAGVDPYNFYIDRNSGDNVVPVT